MLQCYQLNLKSNPFFWNKYVQIVECFVIQGSYHIESKNRKGPLIVRVHCSSDHCSSVYGVDYTTADVWVKMTGSSEVLTIPAALTIQ